MADIADRANDAAEAELQRNLRNARVGEYTLPPGVPGECDLCGNDSLRLIDGACGRCRDFYKLR